MARTVPAALATHLDGSTKTTAGLLTLHKTGTPARLTTHHSDLTVGGDTYTASGLNLAEVSIGIMDSPASGEAEINLNNSSPVTIADIRNGVYRGVKYEIAFCNYADTSNGKVDILKGRVGTIETNDRAAVAVFELKGNLGAGINFIVERYSPACRAITGDARCCLPVLPATGLTHIRDRADTDSTAFALDDYVRVFQSGAWNNRNYKCTTAGTTAASAPTYDTTVGNTTADGTAVFTAEEAWAREAVVVSQSGAEITVTVTEARAVDDTWFEQGYVVFDGGANDGLDSIDIIGWDNASQIVKLANPPIFPMSVSEKMFLVVGDDKTISTCATKLGNNFNFVGEPHTNPFGILENVNSDVVAG
jgi:hypothetical protein